MREVLKKIGLNKIDTWEIVILQYLIELSTYIQAKELIGSYMKINSTLILTHVHLQKNNICYFLKKMEYVFFSEFKTQASDFYCAAHCYIIILT